MSLLESLTDFEIKTLKKVLDDRASKQLNGFSLQFQKDILQKTGSKSIVHLLEKLNDEVIHVPDPQEHDYEDLEDWLQDHRLKKFQLFTDQSVRILDLAKKKYLYINQANENMTGLSNDEFIKKGLSLTYKKIHPWDLLQLIMVNKKVINAFSQMTEEQRMNSKFTYDVRFKHETRGYIRILQNILPVSVTTKGNLAVIIVLSSDISDLKKSNRMNYSFGYWEKDDFVTLFKGKTTAYGNILSKREIEILSLLAEGFTSKEVGEKLHVSPDTVRTHNKNILSKTNSRNITEVVRKAVLEGWI